MVGLAVGGWWERLSLDCSQRPPCLRTLLSRNAHRHYCPPQAAKENAEFRLRNCQGEMKQLRQQCTQATREARRRKQVAEAYAKMCDLHGLRPFQSPYSQKSFISLEHLLAHCERRHPENRPFPEVHALYGKKKNSGQVIDDVYAELEQLRAELR